MSDRRSELHRALRALMMVFVTSQLLAIPIMPRPSTVLAVGQDSEILSSCSPETSCGVLPPTCQGNEGAAEEINSRAPEGTDGLRSNGSTIPASACGPSSSCETSSACMPSSACETMPGCPIWCSTPFLDDNHAPILPLRALVQFNYQTLISPLESAALDPQSPPPKSAISFT